MHFVSRASVLAITVCIGIATAMDRRIEHATTGDRASTPGCDRFGLQRGALKRSAEGAGERKTALSVRCVLSGVLGRSGCWWQRQRGPIVVDDRPSPPFWRPSSSRDG